MAKSRVGKVLQVDWEDAWSNDGTWTPSEVAEAKPLLMTLFGLCVRDTKEAITLAMETYTSPTKNTRYRIVWSVPQSLVRKVHILK